MRGVVGLELALLRAAAFQSRECYTESSNEHEVVKNLIDRGLLMYGNPVREGRDILFPVGITPMGQVVRKASEP